MSVRCNETESRKLECEGVDVNSISRDAINKLSKYNQSNANYNQNDFKKMASLTLNCDDSSVYITQLPCYKPKMLPKITNLSVKNCRIKSIYSDSFINLQSLTDLQLNENALVEIKAQAFSSLINLERLNLARNNLLVLEVSVFENLTNLTHLDVSFNKIYFLPKDIFMNNNKLIQIDFKNNDINIIEVDFNRMQIVAANFSINICLDDSYNSTTVDKLISKVDLECKSSTNKILKLLQIYQKNNILEESV